MAELQTILQTDNGKKISAICAENKGYKWEELASFVDDYIDSFYPIRIISNIYGTEKESITLLTVACINALYKSKEWQYNKLYDSLSLVYEPLNNYDRTETETVITDSTLDTTVKQGAQTNTTSSNINVGARSDKNTTSNIVGARNDSNINVLSVSPSDEKNTFYGKEKNENNIQVGQQSTNIDSTNSLGEQKTTNSATDNIGERNDSKKDVGNVVVDRTLKTKGNIGVTTSQQMLESERQVAYFELVKIIAHDTVNAICSGLWDIL